MKSEQLHYPMVLPIERGGLTTLSGSSAAMPTRVDFLVLRRNQGAILLDPVVLLAYLTNLMGADKFKVH